MKTADVKKLPPLERFLYWVRERHQIYLRRRAGKPKPWTDDEVLQSYFFTNPYRENDKVTQVFRKTVRDPLRNDPRVLFATVAWRWFNYPPTGDLLHRSGLLTEWDPDRCLAVLRPVRDGSGQLFTGAFMINSPGGEPKLEAIVRRITNVWDANDALTDDFRRGAYEGKLTMEAAHDALTEFDGLGGFMAYEIVCDLRHTAYLEAAPDKLTWCNPGPGCSRGLNRILGIDFPKGNNASSPPLPSDWLNEVRGLLGTMQKRLQKMPLFELREVEHSLCEWDKYERMLWGDGRAKRTYPGRG